MTPFYFKICHLDLPKNRSVEVLESVLELMKKTMENGEDVPHLTL
jgi:hypothetical protein